MESTTSGPQEAFIDELRRRRAELRESMTALEVALSGPPAGGLERWRSRVEAALAELSGDLKAHVEITEGEHGLYVELLEAAPRLAGQVHHLTTEHGELRHRIDELEDLLDEVASPDVAGQVREKGLDLLATFVRHRQRGSDLVYEAFEVDVGGLG